MPGQTESYWVASAPEPKFPAQTEDVRADVAVIGGGIVGIVTATLLKESGLTVALVDRRGLAQGCTGYTTAKVTSSHGVIYSHLKKSFGLEGARTYGEANEAGLAWIAERVERDGIECGFERQPNHVYTEDPNSVETLQEEAAAAREAGLPASFTTEVDLPFDVRGAVRFENQAQYHPRDFLFHLARALPGDGSHVFVDTPATGFHEGETSTVATDHGTIHCRDVVIATHLPVFDRGLFFAKAHPYSSYVVAGELAEGRSFEGMYISEGGETRSMRTIPHGSGRLLLVSGNGHKVAHDSPTSKHYESLQAFGNDWWGVSDYPYRWSTHDYVSVDKVPFVGRFTRATEHVYTATGFGKWGMANGVAAAMMISDQIRGKRNRWAPFFDAKRVNLAQVKETVVENAQVAQRFFVDRLPDASSISELPAGQGTVVSSGLHKVAVYKDDAGRLHRMSARCTHLGCIVHWNDGDRTWDCPCHGSRFSAEGSVVNGPAIDDLKRLDP